MSRARTLFPLLETPEYRPYAPIVDQCVKELLDGHVRTPERDALVLERPGPPEVTFAPKPDVASMLREIAGNSGKEAGDALRDLAVILLGAERHEPGFHVIVVARRGFVMLWLPSKACADRATQHVAMAIAALRGVSSRALTAFDLPGLGYAVRSPDCSVCSSWASALRDAKIPLVGRVSPEASPCDGELCAACRAETVATERNAAHIYGLSVAEVARICAPTAVLEAVWSDEDFERARTE